MAIQFTVLSIDDDEVQAPKRSVFDKHEISIGRSRLNDLVLDHPGVSNTHARVRVDLSDGAQRFFISDLDSTNGTMVGNKRLDPRTEVQIPERDRIMIAGYILKVENVPDDLIPKESFGKVTNGHSKRSPTVHVAFDGSDTKSFVRPEAPESTEMPIAEPPAPGLEEPAEIETVTEEKVPEPETEYATPSFTALASLVLEDSDIELDFVATALLRLSGVITHKGKPLPGVVVTDAALGERVTDEAGCFEFGDIIEGTNYELTFKKEGYLISPYSLSGTLLDEDVTLSAEAKRLFAISGKITHKGKPLSGVTVNGGKLGTIITDDTGSYRFENVPEGEEYTLKASKDGFTFGTVRKVA